MTNRKKSFQRKMVVGVMSTIATFTMLTACGEEEMVETPDNEEVVEQPTTSVSAEEFEAYAKNITGGTFIKTINVTNNKGSIEYFSTFDEYKQANAQSMLTEEDYKEYFETGSAIEKIFVSENVRLLRQFPSLSGMHMVLPFDGKTYTMDVDRQQVNDYLGFNVEELSTDDGSWNEKFVDEIVYDDTKRKAFFDEFVEVK